MTTIAERFLLLRGKAKQGDFAKELGINPNTLRSYENGRSIPNQELLQQICVQFSVSPAWLLLGNGPMRTAKASSEETKEQPSIPSSISEVTPHTDCLRCTKLETKLEKVEIQRDDAIEENRQLHRDKAELLREMGELRATVARLEERKNRLAIASGMPSENSGVA